MRSDQERCSGDPTLGQEQPAQLKYPAMVNNKYSAEMPLRLATKIPINPICTISPVYTDMEQIWREQVGTIRYSYPILTM